MVDGIYSDINNAIERLGNNEIGLRPLLGAKKPYGTYRDIFNNPVLSRANLVSSSLPCFLIESLKLSVCL